MAGEPEVELQGCAAAASPGCVPEDAVSPTRSGVDGVGDGGDKWWLQIQSLAPLCSHHHHHHHSGAGHIQRLEAWLLFIDIHQLISS